MLSVAGVVVLSSLTGALWLSLPLIIQIVIDKVMLQGSRDILLLFAIRSGIVLVAASGLETALAYLCMRLAQYGTSPIALNLAVELPRVLLILVIMFAYSWRLGTTACILAGLGGISLLLSQSSVNRGASMANLVIQDFSAEIFPVLFHFFLILSIICVFFYGALILLQNRLTVGQLATFSIINIQLVVSVLRIFNAFA